MRKHALLIAPKFDIVCNMFEKELKPLGIADWVRPNGGYFISLDVMPGCAGSVNARLAELGVTMTPAGATYPYGRDPADSNLRIAPTFPAESELSLAAEMLCLCVKLVSLDKLIKGSETR